MNENEKLSVKFKCDIKECEYYLCNGNIKGFHGWTKLKIHMVQHVKQNNIKYSKFEDSFNTKICSNNKCKQLFCIDVNNQNAHKCKTCIQL